MSKVIFDGVGNMPELGRITAKKNYASSSQAHKMGATSAFNDILHYLAEEKYPSLKNEVGGRVAVYQHPVYGFEKKLVEGTTDQYNYNFIGLYTVGADKGDKGYFGFDTKKSTAIRLEGTDHLKGVGFNYPWQVNGVRKIRYNAAKEALCIVTGSDSSKWTAILEQSACGNAKTEAEIEAYLEQEFKPAYECAYNNNPLIVGVQMDINTINGNIDAFNRMRRDDDRPYSYCEFWIDGEYDLYYFDQETLRYEKNGVNLLYQLGISEDSLAGKSLAEKNKIFIEARVARFKAEAENYFCKDDAIYQLVFLYMIGASDNGEKNMYPYKMDTLASGSRWRFLQDDLDSIFSTDNQGQDTKSYSVELHDFTDDTKSAYVFKGEDSALWQLVELAWPNECKQMGRDILQAMYDLSSKGTKTTDKLMGFFEDYFFARAQEYFTPSAYNNDTEYSYEEAWNNKEYVASVDIHPLAQALGAHLTTERAWVQKRIVYLMSKYGFGGYASNEDTALGIISVRTQTAQGFTLTPAIDSYPTILGGQSQSSSTIERVKAGQPVALAPVGGGNTNTYIVGADFLSDIGDLKGLDIDPSSVVTLSVASKRLRRLKVGDETPEEVTSHLATLAIQRCDSLETVDARNLTTLVGTVDLSQCPRLTEALFDGTNATAVIIAAGSKIETLHLPNSVSTLDLRDTKFLSDFEIGTLANLRFLRLEGAPIVNGFAMLKEAYNTDGQQLKDIRLVGFEYDGTADDLEMIANLANDLDKDGNPHLYNGIDAMGNPTEGNPILEGKLNIDGYVYEESANIVKQQYPTIEFTPKGYYIKFDDHVVQSICATNWGDGVGITEEQMKNVTIIDNKFKGNTEITSFNELEKCTNLSYFGSSNQAAAPFMDCTSLKSVRVPSHITEIGYYSFYNCSSLESVNIPANVTSIRNFAYASCPKLVIEELNAPYLKIIGEGIFNGTQLKKITNLGEVTSIAADRYKFGTSLEEIILPDSCINVGATGGYGPFEDNTNLTYVRLSPNVQMVGSRAFNNCTSLRMVENLDKATQLLNNSLAGCPLDDMEELNMPYLVTLGSAFSNVAKFKRVVSLGSVTTFGGMNGWKELESVNIHEGVTNLGFNQWDGVFYDCPKLGPEIVLPSTLTWIAQNVFTKCPSLNTIICKAVTPPEIYGNTFSKNMSYKIYVPYQSVEAYKTATNWSAYADRIKPLSEYQE